MGLPLSKNFTIISDLVLAPGKPVSTTLLTAIRDNITVVMEGLGGSFLANFTKDHIHDGIGSALIEVGPNLLRNGSWESGATSWDITDYTGGTHTIGATGAMHGDNCLAFTSTAVAQGGGNATNSEYIPCGTGMALLLLCLISASVANVSSKMQVIWYDAAKAQISTTDYFNQANTPTTVMLYGARAVPPANARFCKVNVIGGVPGAGTATGTVYFDGAWLSTRPIEMTTVGSNYSWPVSAGSQAAGTTMSNSAVEVLNYRMATAGWKRVYFGLSYDIGTPYYGLARIYRNGVAYGTLRSADINKQYFSEDLYFDENDTMQIFAYGNAAGHYTTVDTVQIGVDKTANKQWPHFVTLALGVR